MVRGTKTLYTIDSDRYGHQLGTGHYTFEEFVNIMYDIFREEGIFLTDYDFIEYEDGNVYFDGELFARIVLLDE